MTIEAKSIQKIRVEKGMTRAALADKAGVNVETLRLIETDPKRATRKGTLAKLEKALTRPASTKKAAAKKKAAPKKTSVESPLLKNAKTAKEALTEFLNTTVPLDATLAVSRSGLWNCREALVSLTDLIDGISGATKN